MLLKDEMKHEYFGKSGKALFLSTSKYHGRTPGLFKAEFNGVKMVTLASKCYYAKNAGGEIKI